LNPARKVSATVCNQKDNPSLNFFPTISSTSLKDGLLSECKSDYLRTWFAPTMLARNALYGG